jgi:hypothetical protein
MKAILIIVFFACSAVSYAQTDQTDSMMQREKRYNLQTDTSAYYHQNNNSENIKYQQRTSSGVSSDSLRRNQINRSGTIHNNGDPTLKANPQITPRSQKTTTRTANQKNNTTSSQPAKNKSYNSKNTRIRSMQSDSSKKMYLVKDSTHKKINR